MKEQEEAAAGEGGPKDEEVPEQLRLAFREDLGKDAEGKGKEKVAQEGNGVPAPSVSEPTSTTPAPPPPPQAQAPTPTPTRTVQAPAMQTQRRPAGPAREEDIPAWIDKAIIGIVFAIGAIIWLRFFG